MDEEAWPSVLERIRQGDQAAVQQVLAWLYQGEGHQILSRHLREKGVPEQSLKDAAADVQPRVLAVLAAGKFRGSSRGEFVKYVDGICKPVARIYRKRAREIPESDLKSPLEFLDDDTAKDPAMAAILHRDLEAALARVPDRYAQAWSLRYARGCSFDEIATHMGRKPKRARQLVSDARLALSDWMRVLALVVDIHMTPSSPGPGQQVESWLRLWNDGYADVASLWIALQVDKHRLGHQATAVLRHHHTTVRGFTPWVRRQGRQVLLAMWGLGKKKASKIYVVENV